MIPVYRFTYQKKIFVFGILGEPKTLEEFTEYVERWMYIRFFDGTLIITEKITDMRVFDKECPVGFILFGNGQMARTY